MIAPVTFSLDDAALSGGAAIVAAGSGLPRRITGAIDYEARVMALNPSGYWPLNEATNPYVDRTANARDLTRTVGANHWNAAVAGSGVGGSPTLALRTGSSGGGTITPAGTYPEHVFAIGVPFVVGGWVRSLALGGTVYVWTSQGTAPTTTRGMSVLLGSNGTPILTTRDGTTYDQVAGGVAAAPWAGGGWHFWAVKYNGGMGAGTTRFCWDGVWSGAGVSDAVREPGTPTGTVPQPLRPLPASYPTEQQHLAVWAGGVAVPSEAQLSALAGAVPCGTARWTLPTSTAARTLKGVELPGSLARSISSTESRLGVRAYYQIGAGARVEFDPGDDVNAAIPAGSTCYLDADLTHHHLDDLPWIADASGGGPVVLVEEPDPPRHFATVAPVATDVGILAARTLPVEIV